MPPGFEFDFESEPLCRVQLKNMILEEVTLLTLLVGTVGVQQYTHRAFYSFLTNRWRSASTEEATLSCSCFCADTKNYISIGESTESLA